MHRFVCVWCMCMCVCVVLFFFFKQEHHRCCDFSAWNWKTTVGVPSKFQMSINLEASMWYASIKVRVTLMLFPASWHSMTIWNCRCFLYPWLTTRVEKKKKKGAGIVKERLLFRKKKEKEKKSLTLFAFSSAWLQSYRRRWKPEATDIPDWGAAETC